MKFLELIGNFLFKCLLKKSSRKKFAVLTQISDTQSSI